MLGFQEAAMNAIFEYIKTSLGNSQTLVVFILTVLSFIYYIVKVVKVGKSERLLKKLSKSDDGLLDVLEKHPKTKSLVREYRGSFDSADGKTTEYADGYFNPGNFLLAMGINRQAMASAAGVIVGLGVLGTFVGLSYSVSKFDASSLEKTLQSVRELLEGMGTAFFTSLVGMSLSTIYIFFEKKSLGNLSRRLSKISEVLDEKYRISELDRERNRHETFLQELKELFSGKDKNGKVVAAGSLLRSIAEDVNDARSALQNLTEELYERATSKAIKPLLESIQKLGETIQNPGANLAESVVKELKTAMNEMIAELRSGFSSAASSEMTKLSENLAAAAKNLEDFQNAAVTMQGNMTAQGDAMSAELGTVLKTLSQTESSINASLEKVGSVIAGVEQTLGKFQGVQNSANETTLNLNAVSGNAVQTISSMKSAMENFLASITTNSKVNSATVERLLQTLSQSQQGTENALAMSKNVAEAFQNLESELKNTFLSMDQGLKGSSSMLQQVLSALQQTEMRIHASLEKTNGVIENVNGTLGEFREIQLAAHKTTSSLENASYTISSSMDNLKNVQDDFVQKNSEYSAAVRKTGDQILQTLSLSKQQSGEIFDRSQRIVESFQNLKGALEEIFEGYNKGLNGYTDTVTANTAKILGEWTEKIDAFIDNLKGMIERLNETVEDLTDVKGK